METDLVQRIKTSKTNGHQGGIQFGIFEGGVPTEKDAVIAERTEFKIIQHIPAHSLRYLFKLLCKSSVFIQRRVPCDFLHFSQPELHPLYIYKNIFKKMSPLLLRSVRYFRMRASRQ